LSFSIAKRILGPKSILGFGALLGILAGSLVAPAAAQTDSGRLWQAYAGRFISQDGRVIDPQGGDRTTSEGQSYALFFALVNNDRAHFDKVLAWTTANLGQGDLGQHLPAWSWGHGNDGAWGVMDANSASDSDLWIAYDLIEAGRLWKDPHYAVLGKRLASLVARREIVNLPSFGPTLLPGAVGFKFQKFWVVNPSYTPVFVLNRLAAVDPAGPWADVAAMFPTLIQRSVRNGFAMDWLCYAPGGGFSPCLANGKTSPMPVGSYDAIRVYLWAGMLADSSPAKSRLLSPLLGMNTYMQQHNAPPEKVGPDGIPIPTPGPVGFSAALLPYLKSNLNEPAVAQQVGRLQSQLDEKSNLYGASPTYYDQNLALFGTGWLEKRFQFGSSGELLVRWSR